MSARERAAGPRLGLPDPTELSTAPERVLVPSPGSCEAVDIQAVPYPLAHHQPLTSGRQLVVEAQRESGLDPEYWLILPQGRQLPYSPATDQFLQRVTWSSGPDGFVTTWRPHDDPNSPVRIDPEVRFGRPQIGGISTEALWDEAAGGAAPDEIAQVFGLDENDVWWALQYERTHRPRTPSVA